MVPRYLVLTAWIAFTLASCAPESPPLVKGLKAFVGARVIDGTGRDPIEDAVVVVRNGRIEAVGRADVVEVPDGAEVIDVSGRTLIPGLIVAHAHVGDTLGLEGGHYTEENVLRQLRLYARYGITAVNSLGGDQEEGIRLRDAQATPSLDRARLFVAGTVVAADTPEEGRALVDENAAKNVNFIKIRVDDTLGTTEKMPPETYRAVIDHAHEKGLPVASHLYYLDDAKSLLRSGVDFVAHSVRDREVDDELIELFKDRGVCYCPTLTREVSTFVYEHVPDYFEDPFFLKEADPAVLEQLKDPERQARIRSSESAQAYKKALEVATRNLKKLADGGVTIAFGTDSGPPGRFQGYFEHMELAMMVEGGLTPMQALVAATGDAARCLGLDDIGTLEPGKWADFVVLTADPLADIKSSRAIESVWIAGNRVPEKHSEGPAEKRTD